MNIIVSLFGSNGADYCFRPDTTLEKESFDYYIPDGVSELTYSPVLFVRLCRAGKAIGERFAGRYYDSGGFGVLLYGESIIGSGAAAGLSMASSLDKTSLLPFPLIDKDLLENGGNSFSLSVNGRSVNEHSVNELLVNEHSVNEHSVNEHSVNEHSVNEHSVNEHSVNERSANERSANERSLNGNGTFACHPDFAGIPEILHRISLRTSLRTGDIVAVELGERLPIHAGEKLCGMLNGENIFSISVL